MEKIDKILKNKNYIKSIKEIEKLETERKFCKHNFSHLLDVARIAYIINLEMQLGYSKQIIYATALLHDIGRWQEYKDGTPHDKASACLAQKILKECNFSTEEIHIILEAILNHRNVTEDNEFNRLMYMADKQSRNCFLCASYKECKWKEADKNKSIKV